MATNNYAVVNTELMAGTDVRSLMRSFRFGTGEGETFVPADIQNGSVVVLTKPITENGRTEHDLWYANAPKKTDDVYDLVLVATPELLYDPRLTDKHDFTNKAGANATGILLSKHDIFGITIEGLDSDTTPKPGDGVYVQNGTMMKVSAAAVAGSTKIGAVVDTRVLDKELFYCIEVA